MSEQAQGSGGAGALATWDQSKISRFQLKIMLVSGMGFFAGRALLT
jgi:hypothetical protein